MKRTDRVTSKSGMGGYLNPPNHPEHTHHVETDTNRKPDNRGSASLCYALEDEWISDQTKKEIKALLDNWEATKLPINHPDSLVWVSQCMKHFGFEKGVAFIQKYYPESNVKYTVTVSL